MSDKLASITLNDIVLYSIFFQLDIMILNGITLKKFKIVILKLLRGFLGPLGGLLGPLGTSWGPLGGLLGGS